PLGQLVVRLDDGHGERRVGRDLGDARAHATAADDADVLDGHVNFPGTAATEWTSNEFGLSLTPDTRCRAKLVGTALVARAAPRQGRRLVVGGPRRARILHGDRDGACTGAAADAAVGLRLAVCGAARWTVLFERPV